eukprot:448294_1
MSLWVKLFTVCLFSMASQTVSDSPPYCDDGYPIIIVGSGLAGHAAASEALSLLKSQNKLKSHPIVIFEKEPKPGGNSYKATSGINGANTEFQKQAHIQDNVNDFRKDTYYSSIGGAHKVEEKKEDVAINPLITTLTQSSASAVDWLQHKFNLQLTAITQCGGHSHPRTHRPPAGGAGYTIVSTIHKQIEKNVEFKYNSEVIGILVDTDSKTVIGIKYKDHNNNGAIQEFYGTAVLLTSGGFGNDHSVTSLLKKYGQNKEEVLPTTNGKWATGDGVKMGAQIGGKLIDMSQIQIHPTGFVDPKEPEAKTKILAPEALRGTGGILINSKGQRFVNELDLRATIVQQMQMENAPFRLLMNDAVREEFGKNMNFYINVKGLVKAYENVEALSKDIEVDVNVLSATIKQYVEDAKNGKDAFGKQVFPNGDSYDVMDTIYAAQITPVIHYTMGGLGINDKAEILDVNDNVIPGFYGAGEVTGGVHGKNRLAGNSLLECVVYGRIAARNAIEYCKVVNQRKKTHHDDL